MKKSELKNILEESIKLNEASLIPISEFIHLIKNSLRINPNSDSADSLKKLIPALQQLISDKGDFDFDASDLIKKLGLQTESVKRSELNKIIREEIDKVIKENPDTAKDGLKFDDKNAVPFSYSLTTGLAYVGLNKAETYSGRGTRSALHSEIHNEYNKKFIPLSNAGRLWPESKKISFWELQIDAKPKILKAINSELTRRKADFTIDNSWEIELCDIWKYEDTGDEKLSAKYFPINDFITSKIDYNQYKASWTPIMSDSGFETKYVTNWYTKKDMA